MSRHAFPDPPAGETSWPRRWLWFIAIWAMSVAVVAGFAEALHWWIAPR